MKNIELYKINEVRLHRFYQLPKELFTNSKYAKTTSLCAKVTYAFLLDRLELSRTNNWYNEKGEVFLIFTREELMGELCISRVTVTKVFKELNEVGLVYEYKQGQGKPNLIYIGKIRHEEIDYSECKDVNFQKFKNYTSRSLESELPEVKNLCPNNTNIKNTEFNNNLIPSYSNNIDSGSFYENLIKENVEFEKFIQDPKDRTTC